MLTARRDAFRRRRKHLKQFGAGVAAPFLHQTQTDAFTGQGIRNEDSTTIGKASHCVSAVNEGFEGDFVFGEHGRSSVASSYFRVGLRQEEGENLVLKEGQDD